MNMSNWLNVSMNEKTKNLIPLNDRKMLVI